MRADVAQYDVFGGCLHYTIRRTLKDGGYEWFWTWKDDYNGCATVFRTRAAVKRAIAEDGAPSQCAPTFTITPQQRR